MNNTVPLANGIYTLEKFPGKGGWTYAAIPGLSLHKENPFGWIKIYGTIDNYTLSNYKLMPMGNGCLFLPVKAAIRKVIKKEAGDKVSITLYEDHAKPAIPDDLLSCLKDNTELYNRFFDMQEAEQEKAITKIITAKNNNIREDHIAQLLNKLEKMK